MKVAITGSTGLVGSRVIELLQNDFEFLSLPSKDLDITNRNEVFEKLKLLNYDFFLHFAAYTNVDGAETERDTAYKINVEGTRNVFEATQGKNKQFIYISTDFVFDGKNPPFFEDSQPNPISYYGQTKYEGEEVVQNNAMIVRVSYPYGQSPAPKKDFARTIKSLLEQGKQVRMVTDALITPTHIDDIAYVLSHLMTNFKPEIYHIVGSQSLSPYDAGKLIAKTFKFNESLVQPTTYEEYFNGKAKRPQYGETKSKKNDFHSMKSFEAGLQQL